MSQVYRTLRPLQRTLPPIRSKWIAIPSYALLALLFAIVLPELAKRAILIQQRSNGLTFALVGGLYGYCKWAYAEGRWQAEREQKWSE